MTGTIWLCMYAEAPLLIPSKRAGGPLDRKSEHCPVLLCATDDFTEYLLLLLPACHSCSKMRVCCRIERRQQISGSSSCMHVAMAQMACLLQD